MQHQVDVFSRVRPAIAAAVLGTCAGTGGHEPYIEFKETK